MHRFVVGRISVLAMVTAVFAAWPCGSFAQHEVADPPPATVLEDPVTPLDPRKSRTPAEEDAVAAHALFAQARIRFQRQDFAGSLRLYQRAWRLDPDSAAPLREIVPLAFALQHSSEAARYAVLVAERDPSDPVLLRRLAMHLTELQQLKRAVAMYALSLEASGEGDAPGTVVTRREMGRLYFLLEDYPQAAESMAVVRDALADPKRFGLDDSTVKALLGNADRTYTLMGECFLQAGRLDDAADMFRKANEEEANEGLLAFELARIEAARENHDAAWELLDKYFAAKLTVGGTEPYELASKLLAKKLGDATQADASLLTRLAELYADDAANAPLAYFLADRYLAAGELGKAEQTYRSALALQETIDGYTGLLKVHLRSGDQSKLLADLGSALVKTGTLEPLGETGKAIAADKQLANRLIAAAEQKRHAGEATWGEGEALAIATLALAAKRPDVADAYFDLALAADHPPKAELMVTWGMELFMAEEFDRAASVFRRAIDENIDPDRKAIFYFYLAGPLELGGKTDDALAAARKAAELEPQSARLHSRQAWILYHAHRYDEAVTAYTDLLAQFDDKYTSDDIREVMRDARLALSNICVHQENLPEAERWLEEVLDEFPEDIGAQNDLGYLWADQNKYLHRALVMVQAAVEGDPENMAYRDSLGWALFRQGRYQEAVAELEKAAELAEETDGVVFDHLGDAYWHNGDHAKAHEVWRKAADAFREDKDEKKLKEVEEKIANHPLP